MMENQITATRYYKAKFAARAPACEVKTQIFPGHTVRDLGVTFDVEMFFSTHVTH